MKNYQRLQDFVRISTIRTNDYFHWRGEFSRNPKKLYNELKNYEDKINELLNDGTLTKGQFNTIFPPGRDETFSERFDLPLLIILIANFVDTGKSIKFWMSNRPPSPNDTTVVAGYKYFVMGRNCANHSPGFVERDEYKDIAKNYFMKGLIKIGEEKKSFHHLLPPLTYKAYKPIKNFFGREKDIKAINSIIENEKSDLVRLVVCGMAGLGKSEIVRKYFDIYSSLKSEL